MKDSQRELAKRIGNNLKKLRLARNMTQAQVAKFLNVSAATYGRLERSTVLLRIRYVGNIVSLFGVSSDDLINP